MCFILPIPRKGIETQTQFVCAVCLHIHPRFILPIPRKGIETSIDLPTPVGFKRFILPIPRKGIETFA